MVGPEEALAAPAELRRDGAGLPFLGADAGFAHAEEAAHGFARDGASVEPALRLGAAVTFERGADLLGLDALGADRNVERVAEAGDGVDDLGRALALDDGGDEALVDLDPVERQAVDLGEARVAGTEIVERDADTDVLEALDDGEDLLAVLEQRAFGDLDLEPVGGEAGGGEQLQNLLGERGIAELDRRDVDRELQMRRPVARLLHRLLHD